MGRFAFLVLALFVGHAWPQDLDLGRRIYLDGVTASGEPLAALVGFGRMPLSGRAVACGNCHGPDGKGRPEASVLPTDITWQELTKPYGHSRPGRSYGPFDERSFVRAVNEGLDPAGNRLDWSMPRYALSRTEGDALVAYVKRLDERREPGVAEHALRIGMVLPEHASAPAMRAALADYVEGVNRAGGIHQRRLELIAVNGEPGAQTVFALLSASESGVGTAGVPTIAPFAQPPHRAAERDALVFRVLPGIVEQAAVLVDFASRRSAPLRGAIVASGAPGDDHAAQAAALRCAARNCGDLARVGWYATRFDAAAVVRRLKSERREQLFFFGSEHELQQLLEHAAPFLDDSWRPSIHAAASLARTAVGARERFAGRLFLAFPALPTGRALQHEGAQMGMLAGAAVLVEGLRRAGRDLSRERFVQSLESLSNYDPGGFAPPVSFGPDRRTGARGGYVVAVERALGIVPASAWIALD